MWIALATFIVGLVFGYEHNKIRREIQSLKSSVVERKETPAVLSGNPSLVQEDKVNDSAVITPNSPQMIDWQEEQELHKMNPGKYS